MRKGFIEIEQQTGNDRVRGRINVKRYRRQGGLTAAEESLRVGGGAGIVVQRLLQGALKHRPLRGSGHA